MCGRASRAAAFAAQRARGGCRDWRTEKALEGAKGALWAPLSREPVASVFPPKGPKFRNRKCWGALSCSPTQEGEAVVEPRPASLQGPEESGLR